MERTDLTHPQHSPRAAAFEPLGDLISADALHTNPAARDLRSWVTVGIATAVAAGADQRAARTEVTA